MPIDYDTVRISTDEEWKHHVKFTFQTRWMVVSFCKSLDEPLAAEFTKLVIPSCIPPFTPYLIFNAATACRAYLWRGNRTSTAIVLLIAITPHNALLTRAAFWIESPKAVGSALPTPLPNTTEVH